MNCRYGQLKGNRVFCHHSAVAGRARYASVARTRCVSCTFRSNAASDLALPVLNECVHRGRQVKDSPCGCASLYRCRLHGQCTTGDLADVIAKLNSAGDQRTVVSCSGCNDQWHPLLNKTEVIIPFFNPLGWYSRTKNLVKIRAASSRIAPLIRVATAESATGGQTYWLKEALINRCVAESSAEYIAWVDADLVWDDPCWLERGLLLMDKFDAVQLWQTMRREDGGDVTAAGYHWHTGARRDGAPGGAWLMRRSTFNRIGGLPEYMITGGADAVALDAWTQQERPWHWDDFSDELRLMWTDYRERCTGLRVAYLPVTVSHLFHGQIEHRQYEGRTDILRRFEPSRHMKLADNGIPELIDTSIASAAKAYLQSRREDD